MKTALDKKIKELLSGNIADPFSLLGAHPVSEDEMDGFVVWVFLPEAKSVIIEDLSPGNEIPATAVNRKGVFEAVIPGIKNINPYHLKVDFGTGTMTRFYDCYSFLPVLTDFDLYLFGQGNHYSIYEKLGAHPYTHQGVSGILFGVWAPSASRVSVVGTNKMLSIGAFIFGASLICFSFSHQVFLSLILMLFTGFHMILVMASSNIMLQTIAEEDKRGRIISLYVLALMGTAPFGSLLAGIAANHIGAPNTLLAGGIVCMLASVFFYLKLPAIRAQVQPIYRQLGLIEEMPSVVK